MTYSFVFLFLKDSYEQNICAGDILFMLPDI